MLLVDFYYLQKFVGVTSCPQLLPPNNGIIVGGNSPPTHVGATVEFQCNLGYNFEKEASTVRAVCKCTGEWQYTPVKPYCKREIKPPYLTLQIGKFFCEQFFSVDLFLHHLSREDSFKSKVHSFWEQWLLTNAQKNLVWMEFQLLFVKRTALGTL